MATIRIESFRVIRACEAYSKQRDKNITFRRENMIKSVMSGWWFPAKTREAAIERLKNTSDGYFSSRWDSAEDYGLFRYQDVTRLLAIAKEADIITLTADDFDLIKSFMEEV